MAGIKFRHSAGFGRRMEYWLIGRMLREGLDVYVPLVDDFGIDAVIRKQDNHFVEVQIKARSSTVLEGDAALFAAIDHPKPRGNYYFVFYSERLDAMWIMSSEQFIAEAVQNKKGKNAGKRSIWFNGTKTNKATGKKVEYAKERYDKYRADDFSIFRQVSGLVVAPATASSVVSRLDGA
jgi:hypothetical protein